MERESFEDLEVAEILNTNFISIKVDREERPDIDHIYMDVCQALTGHGGWPLTIIMTPDQKPFFAGTYFPKNDRMGIQGLISILNAVKRAWETKRDELINSGDKITEYIAAKRISSNREISEDIFDRAFSYYKQYFDEVYGGFGNAPKFPTPHNLMFLLRYWKIYGENTALQMVEKTLDAMYKGGIYDHIGFGFSRYSTDKKWLVPHFEKMLYDNALLAIVYLEAYQATKKDKYGIIARDILTYILRDMTSPNGGFYCAEDADSEGVEGKFYLWTLSEIKDILGEDDGRRFASFYNITSKGNLEGKNILNLINNNLTFDEINNLKHLREKLFQYRERRIHPHKDDKILTSWNGLMIGAMAIAGRLLKEERFTKASEKALDFIYNNLINSEGRLLARYREGEAAYLGYAEDYAFLTFGLIELYETTLKSHYLKKALELCEKLINLFWDEQDGGLYVYGNDSEKLISRPKEIYDGAMPSSNSVAALNFIRLSRLTGRQDLESKAHEIFKAFSDEISINPMSYSYSLMTLLYTFSKGKEAVIVAKDEEESKHFIEELNLNFNPFTVWLLKKSNDNTIEKIAPFIQSYDMKDNKPTAYICEGISCNAPVTDIEEFKKLLYL
ncbi:MAG: thioredoxin domain-containing protein [Clostridiaceae bacterium]|nr:thioredoxin domain-containing protein [Clostridiaceae bacterium]